MEFIKICIMFDYLVIKSEHKMALTIYIAWSLEKFLDLGS